MEVRTNVSIFLAENELCLSGEIREVPSEGFPQSVLQFSGSDGGAAAAAPRRAVRLSVRRQTLKLNSRGTVGRIFYGEV